MTQVGDHQPCPCGKSSDAYSLYPDGWGHCFSCGDNFPPDTSEPAKGKSMGKSEGLPLLHDLSYEPLTSRKITQATCKRYGYGIVGDQQVAPYYNENRQLIAQKVRGPDKTFTVRGDLSSAGLFGQQLCNHKGKRVVVTEGEIDALSISQAMGNTWPVLSVPSGAQSAMKSLKANLETLENFDTVVLCFDNDDPGRKALEECVQLFSPGKVATMDLGAYKDANDALMSEGTDFLRTAVWGAQVWRPDGIVNLKDMRARIKKPLVMGTTYPWEGLNKLLFGFRPQELVTWTAGTGVGKTAVVSELVYALITHGKKVGIIYLEEGVDRAGRRIVGLHMNKPLHLPDVEYDEKEFDEAFEATLGTGNLVAYDHFGSLDEHTLSSRIRYMVKALDCEVIVLDHISMVVSGQSLDTDERRMLDHIMTNLRSMTQETGASFHVVSHLRRPQGSSKSHEEGMAVSLSHLRGTQAIAQLSDAVIAAERDQQADTELARNTTTLRVLKNRYAGMTGVACELLFDPKTGRLTEVDSTDFGEGGDY